MNSNVMTNRKMMEIIIRVANPKVDNTELNTNEVFSTVLSAHCYVRSDERVEQFYKIFREVARAGALEGRRLYREEQRMMSLNACIRSATAAFTIGFIRAWYDEVFFMEQMNRLNMNEAFDTELYFARLRELDEETHIFNLLGFEMDISVLDEE